LLAHQGRWHGRTSSVRANAAARRDIPGCWSAALPAAFPTASRPPARSGRTPHDRAAVRRRAYGRARTNQRS